MSGTGDQHNMGWMERNQGTLHPHNNTANIPESTDNIHPMNCTESQVMGVFEKLKVWSTFHYGNCHAVWKFLDVYLKLDGQTVTGADQNFLFLDYG